MRDQGLQFSSESHLSHSQGDKDPKLISQLDSFWLIMGTRNPPTLAWGYQFKDRIMRTSMIDSQSKRIQHTFYQSFIYFRYSLFIPPFCSLGNRLGPSALRVSSCGSDNCLALVSGSSLGGYNILKRDNTTKWVERRGTQIENQKFTIGYCNLFRNNVLWSIK